MWIFLILSRKRFLVTQCLKLTLFQEHAYHCIFNAHLSFLMPTRVFSTVFKYFCERWNFTKLKISNQRVLIVAMIMNTRQLSTSKPFSQRKCHNKNHSTPDLTKFPYNAITCKQQRLIFFYKQRVRQQFLTSHIHILLSGLRAVVKIGANLPARTSDPLSRCVRSVYSLAAGQWPRLGAHNCCSSPLRARVPHNPRVWDSCGIIMRSLCNDGRSRLLRSYVYIYNSRPTDSVRSVACAYRRFRL